MATRKSLSKKMNRKEAARIGGLARQAKHGNLGTPEGRSRGGINSLLTHVRLKTKFNLLKKIRIPPHNEALAELLGVLAGDGHVGTYQIAVTTNSLTDREHADHVARLLRRLFSIRIMIRARPRQNACVVVASSRMLSDFLIGCGAVKGNKIENNIGVPRWVECDMKYRTAFIRGLFDTDGCVYIDVHRIRDKTYRNIGIALSNRSPRLLKAFKRHLIDIGLHPTQKTEYEVFLRRESEIRVYFDVVGSSNPKHVRKMRAFFSQ